MEPHGWKGSLCTGLPPSVGTESGPILHFLLWKVMVLDSLLPQGPSQPVIRTSAGWMPTGAPLLVLNTLVTGRTAFTTRRQTPQAGVCPQSRQADRDTGREQDTFLLCTQVILENSRSQRLPTPRARFICTWTWWGRLVLLKVTEKPHEERWGSWTSTPRQPRLPSPPAAKRQNHKIKHISHCNDNRGYQPLLKIDKLLHCG